MRDETWECPKHYNRITIYFIQPTIFSSWNVFKLSLKDPQGLKTQIYYRLEISKKF